MSERTQGKTIAVLIGILAFFGIGLAVASAGGKKKRPVCGVGKKAIFNEGTKQWECIDIPAPECNLGEHAEWQARDEEWKCVPDVGPDEPGKPKRPVCGVGKRAIFDEDTNSWSCVVVDKPECNEGEHAEWLPRTEEWKCVLDVPIVEPGNVDDIVKPLPRGGNFWKWRKDWTLFGTKIGTTDKAGSVAYTLMRMEAFEAAKQYGGLDDAAAWAWVNARKYDKLPNLRVQVANIILCSGWNDATAGTYGYCGPIAIANKVCPSTMENHPGPHGRAIRPLPQHADQVARLKAGKAPARVVTIGNAASKGDGSSHTVPGAPGGNLPTLWMPRFNREVIWTSGGITFTTEGLDPVGTAMPPQWVLDLRIEDFSKSGLTTYGCFDTEWSPEG